MSTAGTVAPHVEGASDGGAAARRAVMRWAWRMFRREWRQQLLVLALVIVAVGALLLAAAVATNNPTPANVGFGTAKDVMTFEGPVPHLASKVAALEHRFGRVQVIENQSLTIPGSTETYQLRAESSHGAFSGPLLSLVSGRYPTSSGEVAVTKGVATGLGLRIGSTWIEGGISRRVVGIVEDPLDTLDQFALVVPGQVRSPSDVELLFSAPGVDASKIGPNVQNISQVQSHNLINPETIIAMVAVLGMVLIALVSVGGFTVLAQRRLRSLGLLAATGATTKNVRLVVKTNGAIVGVVGAVVGALLGFVVWLIYRPTIEGTAHHVIGPLQLPWVVIGPAMALAVIATYLAARRPARTVANVPVHAALSGRPLPPRKVRWSAVPGLVFFVIAFALLSFAAGSGGQSSPKTPFLIFGLVALIPAVILLSPFCLAFAARIGRFLPIGPRLALRDVYRYRARSGSAMAGISVSVLAAVITAVVAAYRYGQYLDYAGPNLASNQVVVYSPPPAGTVFSGPNGKTSVAPKLPPMTTLLAKVHEIASALGAKSTLELVQANAGLSRATTGRNWNGQIYVATPQLLRAYGIKPSTISASADVLTWRPGIAGLSKMQLTWSAGKGGSGPGPSPTSSNPYPCPKSSCIWNPTIQHVGALPSGTSAPNTVFTEHAVRTLHLQTYLAGWFIVTNHPPTAEQIRNARFIANEVSGMSIETKSSAPPGSEVIDLATLFGIVLALAILAMSIGLIRSETAGDLRTLAATGASGWTRRTITAATAGALGFFGAVLGTFAAYLGLIAFVRTDSMNGGESTLLNTVPVNNLLEILVAMPIAAVIVAWLLSGREPGVVARQAIE